MWGVVHEFESGRVGATLVVARVGTVHEFESARDKPVPYTSASYVSFSKRSARSAVGRNWYMNTWVKKSPARSSTGSTKK